MSLLVAAIISFSLAFAANVKPCNSNLNCDFPILTGANMSVMVGWVQNNKILVEPNCELKGSAYLVVNGSELKKLAGNPGAIVSTDEVSGNTSGAFVLDPKWNMKDNDLGLIFLGEPPKDFKVAIGLANKKSESSLCQKEYPKARVTVFSLKFGVEPANYFHAFSEVKPGLECREYFGRVDGNACQELGRRIGDCEAHYSKEKVFATEVVGGVRMQKGRNKQDFLWLKDSGWESSKTFIVPLELSVRRLKKASCTW